MPVVYLALVPVAGLGEGGHLHGPNLSRQLHCASRNRFPGRQRTWYIRPLSFSRTIGNPVPSLTLVEARRNPRNCIAVRAERVWGTDHEGR